MGAELREMDGKRLILPSIMLIIGVVAAALVAAMPQAMLDVLMWRLGLPHIWSTATPPIGAFGRTLLALIVLIPFVAVAAVALRRRGYLLGVQHKPALASPDAALRGPTIRRADAHPDAAPRRPIRAEEDLGPPLPMMPAPAPRAVRRLSSEFTLPRDLDQPLAAFDPIAIPDVPRDPVRAVPPLTPAPAPAPSKIAAAEDLAPPTAPVVDISARCAAWLEPSALDARRANPDLPIMKDPGADQPAGTAEEPLPQERVLADAAASDEAQSLASLLDRLERGARHRKVPDPAPVPPTPSVAPAPPAAPSQPETLTDTLSMLRQMARR